MRPAEDVPDVTKVLNDEPSVRRLVAAFDDPRRAAEPAITLHVSTDSFVFDEHERGPADELRLAFEATNDLDADERAMIRNLIEAVVLKHEARRWAS